MPVVVRDHAMGNAVPTNPLAAGFYTVDDAARLIEVGSARRILGWLRGYPDRQIGPLLHRDYQPLGGRQELSFLDLMEVRFVEHLRDQGVKVRTLRKALEAARALFGEAKPLASDKVRFLLTADRKNVLVEEVLKPAAQEAGDTRLWNLLTRQYEMWEVIQAALAKGVSFDPRTHLAARWAPRPDSFPTILIDPRIAYGQPIIPALVPTRAIADIWAAEGGEVEAAADWFGIPVEQARDAVGFELALNEPKQALAA